VCDKIAIASEIILFDIMGDSAADIDSSGLRGLQSSASLKRLSLISNLRSRGVGDHIDLPQLVVSGDQSTGKSSVLEGITGVPFPRQDGLCTRFATEITMEHTDTVDAETEITATIIPSDHRDEAFKEELRAFIRRLEDFHELPAVIEAAGELMGLKGYGTVQSGPAFGQDVLRIKVRGNTALNLTIVDLPGIIQVPNDEQDDNDVDTVHALVDSYISNPRTIILAVVQAGNDISNQPIVKKSKKFDKEGERTIGVITKPDLINDGTQSRIAALSRNEDTTKLKLGFFMVKNPSPKELQDGISMLEREQKELTYFSSPPWKDAGLDRTRIGVASLRRFLQDLLSRHTEREMPKVREEVRSLLKSTEKSISGLGEERPTTSHMRIFLSRLAMRYHNLTNAALIGDYDSSELDFFNTSALESRRLRAFIHSVNTKYSDRMRLEGETVRIVSEPEESDEDLQIADLQEVAISQDRIRQMSVSEEKFIAWIKHVS
jgi:GTPase SAR1 family protein